MTEKNTRSIFVTLSLPVTRRKWILSQWLFAALLSLVLATMAGILILLGGLVFGKTYPLSQAIWGTLLLTFVALPWISLTLAMTSILQDKLKTVLTVAAIAFVVSILKIFESTQKWLPFALLDSLENEVFPWRSISVILLVTLGGLYFAIRRFETRDY
jgi:ABC-type transport system involved in multi-copper enzyme maturation permease subunit